MPEGVNAKPNGVPPTAGCEIAALSEPSPCTRNVSIVFDALLVTTSAVPAGLMPTWAGPWSPDASGRHAPWIRRGPTR